MSTSEHHLRHGYQTQDIFTSYYLGVNNTLKSYGGLESICDSTRHKAVAADGSSLSTDAEGAHVGIPSC